MKFILTLIIISLLFISCKQFGSEKNLLCKTSKGVKIQFTRPFNYSKTDTLYIDELKFTHVGYIDSLPLGNYLPMETMVVVEINKKQAKEKSNEISMARALARTLIRTNTYVIKNGPELLTSGKLKIERKDGKKIKICFSKKYAAVLLE